MGSDRAPRPPRPPRRGRTRRTTAVALALALALGAGCTDGVASSTPRPSPTEGRTVVVTSITDGDTFRAGDERVRIIGIDTPEIAEGPDCFGPEATTALERAIPVGSEVVLVADAEPVDRYDRTLAYVHRVDDDRDVGLALLDGGFARVLSVAPNVARADAYARAEAAARDAGAGLWTACPDAAPATTEPAPATAGGGAADPPGSGGCDPSYPDVCIPPSPPDLDCADIAFRRFRVLPPDPHRFDDAGGAGNGIGCEAG